MSMEDTASSHCSQRASRNPSTLNFFHDATYMAQGEVQSPPKSYKAGKTSRLVKNLVQFGQQQDKWDCEQKEKLDRRANSLVRKFRNRVSFVRKLCRRFPLGESAQRRKLLTWRYESYWRMRFDDKDLMNRINESMAGEQNKILPALLTRILHGSSRKQLRPLHVEAAVLFAWLGASGFHFDTKLLWNYRSVLAEGVGVSVSGIEVIIRVYDYRLRDLVVDYLNALKPRQVCNDNVQIDHNSGGTGQASYTDTDGNNHENLRTTAGTTDNTRVEARGTRGLEYEIDLKGNLVRWSAETEKNARNVALGFVNELCGISIGIAELVAQFWDNVASMTYPICKFEHGRNRFIFRTSTGELCTGTSVMPKLALQEIEAGAEAGTAGTQVSGTVRYMKQKPDLQVITSDYAIDCSINVLGRRRVLSMRDRRALRTCMMLAHHTSYNLDKTGYTAGILAVSGAPEKDKDVKKAFTCNMPPDLLSLLLCNQMVSTVNCNGITVITGLMVRGRHFEFLREHANLRVTDCASSSRPREDDPYTEIVRKLIEGNQRARGTREGAEDSKWERVVCGAVRLLLTARSSFLLTSSSSREDASDSYQLHELSDTLAHAYHTSIQVL